MFNVLHRMGTQGSGSWAHGWCSDGILSVSLQRQRQLGKSLAVLRASRCIQSPGFPWCFLPTLGSSHFLLILKSSSYECTSPTGLCHTWSRQMEVSIFQLPTTTRLRQLDWSVPGLGERWLRAVWLLRVSLSTAQHLVPVCSAVH